MAEVLDIRRRPRIPVPLITPWLSSLWIGLVTPVDAGVARPLIEGLAVPTVVTDPSGTALFDIAPIDFDQALRQCRGRRPGTGKRVRVLGRLFVSRPGGHGHGRPAHDSRRGTGRRLHRRRLRVADQKPGRTTRVVLTGAMGTVGSAVCAAEGGEGALGRATRRVQALSGEARRAAAPRARAGDGEDRSRDVAASRRDAAACGGATRANRRQPPCSAHLGWRRLLRPQRQRDVLGDR